MKKLPPPPIFFDSFVKDRKIKSIYILFLFHFINHIVCFYFLFTDRSVQWLLYSFLIWNILASFGVSIGFHRLLAHRSFQTYKWFEKLCVFLGCLSTGGSPISWAGIHRMHHEHTDTKADPHSPRILGWFRVHFNLWKVDSIPKKYVKDLISDQYLLFLHRNYYKILIIYSFFLVLVDLKLFVYTYSVPSVMAFHSFGFINSLGHTLGYKNFKNNAKNNWFVNLWTAGEGWHNNHHQMPSSYRIGFRWFEWDLSAFFLEALSLIKSSKVIDPKKKFFYCLKSMK